MMQAEDKINPSRGGLANDLHRYSEFMRPAFLAGLKSSK